MHILRVFNTPKRLSNSLSRFTLLPKSSFEINRKINTHIPVVDNLEEYLKSHNLYYKSSLNEKETALFLSKASNRNGSVYAGFDPTAPSLHLGNLLPIMALSAFYIHGFDVYFLVGGGTASLGDPTGKSKERELIDAEKLEHNRKEIHILLRNLTNNISQYFKDKGYSNLDTSRIKIVDNKEWLSDTNILTFFRDVGRLIRAGPLIDREYVQARLKSGVGISLAEFVYQSFQAYDFYHLFRTFGINIQIGGADQWGNLMSGVTLIEKGLNSDVKLQSSYKKLNSNGQIVSSPVLAFTTPLLVDSKGEKIGKSTGDKKRAWLSKNSMSPLDFFTFCRGMPDNDAAIYIKSYTCISKEEFIELRSAHEKNPKNRLLQKRLAVELTWLVHGKNDMELCIEKSEILTTIDILSNELKNRPDDIKLNDKFRKIAEQAVSLLKNESSRVFFLKKEDLSGEKSLSEILFKSKNSLGNPVVPNKQMVSRLISTNSVRFNGINFGTKPNKKINCDDFISRRIGVIRLNKDTTVFVILI